MDIQKMFQDVIAPELRTLAGKIDESRTELRTEIHRVDEKIDGLRTEMRTEFHRVDEKIDGFDKRVDQRMDGLDEKIGMAIDLRERLAALGRGSSLGPLDHAVSQAHRPISGTERPRQIFRASASEISVCLGTASTVPVVGFVQRECARPSRFK